MRIKRILLLLLVFSLSCRVAYAQDYLDLLIHTSDTSPYSQDRSIWTPKMVAYDKASNVKQGYLAAVKPLGSPWGKLENDPKRFTHVIIPKEDFKEEWFEAVVDAKGEEILNKRWSFPLDKILTKAEYEALKEIPYNDSTLRPKISKNENDISNIVELTDFQKIIDNPIKLHGSSGTFSVQEDGGGDYTSLRTAVETEAADLTAGGGTGNAIFNVELAWDNADTGNWDVDGYTTDSSNYIEITALGIASHDNGTWRATGWRIDDATQVFDIEHSYTEVTGIQWTNVGHLRTSDTKIGVVIDKCFGFQTGTGTAIVLFDGSATVTNTVLHKVKAVETSSEGILMGSAGVITILIQNCTISGFNDGIEVDGGAVTVENCAIFNNDDDFDGSFTSIDYCASDDGDGNNPVDISPGTETTDWGNAVTDYANGDYSIKNASSVLYNAGMDTGLSDDIIGTARPQVTTYDIGAFELVVSTRRIILIQ